MSSRFLFRWDIVASILSQRIVHRIPREKSTDVNVVWLNLFRSIKFCHRFYRNRLSSIYRLIQHPSNVREKVAGAFTASQKKKDLRRCLSKHHIQSFAANQPINLLAFILAVPINRCGLQSASKTKWKQNLSRIERGQRKPTQEKRSWFNMTIQVTLRNNFHLPQQRRGDTATEPAFIHSCDSTHSGFVSKAYFIQQRRLPWKGEGQWWWRKNSSMV